MRMAPPCLRLPLLGYGGTQGGNLPVGHRSYSIGLMMSLRVLAAGEFGPHHLSRPTHLFHSYFRRVISAAHPMFHILKVIPKSVFHFFVAGFGRRAQAKAPPGASCPGAAVDATVRTSF